MAYAYVAVYFSSSVCNLGLNTHVHFDVPEVIDINDRKGFFTSRISETGNIFGSDVKFCTHIRDHHTSDKFEGQGHQGQKCKNSSLVSENVGQGQEGHDQCHQAQGQGRRSKSQGSESKVTKVKVKGRRSRSQGHGQKLNVKGGDIKFLSS